MGRGTQTHPAASESKKIGEKRVWNKTRECGIFFFFLKWIPRMQLLDFTDLYIIAGDRSTGGPGVENIPGYVQTQHPVWEGELLQTLLRLRK